LSGSDTREPETPHLRWYVFNEPSGAFDGLRNAAPQQLRLGTTTIYVIHDQTEALTPGGHCGIA